MVLVSSHLHITGMHHVKRRPYGGTFPSPGLQKCRGTPYRSVPAWSEVAQLTEHGSHSHHSQPKAPCTRVDAHHTASWRLVMDGDSYGKGRNAMYVCVCLWDFSSAGKSFPPKRDVIPSLLGRERDVCVHSTAKGTDGKPRSRKSFCISCLGWSQVRVVAGAQPPLISFVYFVILKMAFLLILSIQFRPLSDPTGIHPSRFSGLHFPTDTSAPAMRFFSLQGLV